MIFDRIENIGRYKSFNLEFVLNDLEKEEFGQGRFEINGDMEFGIDLQYDTKVEEECLWEAHRQYLDIHVVLEGEEIIHISDIDNMNSTKQYELDYELFEGQKEQIIHLMNGFFLLLFPNETHRTSIMKGDSPVAVRKKVYKKIII